MGLLQQSELHRNSRFVDIAAMLVKRYSAGLGPAHASKLGQQVAELSRRFSSGATHIAGIQRGNRSPGALVLKV
jgi:hypothetical protein